MIGGDWDIFEDWEEDVCSDKYKDKTRQNLLRGKTASRLGAKGVRDKSSAQVPTIEKEASF